MMFILGFLCGVVAEFAFLIVLAAGVQVKRNREILENSAKDIDNGNK